MWNHWAAKIKETINKHIPYTFTASQPFFAISLKATKLYSALKNINRCLQHLLNNATNIIIQANYYLSKAATLVEINITPITQEKFTLFLFIATTELMQIIILAPKKKQLNLLKL